MEFECYYKQQMCQKEKRQQRMLESSQTTLLLSETRIGLKNIPFALVMIGTSSYFLYMGIRIVTSGSFTPLVYFGWVFTVVSVGNIFLAFTV
jgi:hypothetical protein